MRAADLTIIVVYLAAVVAAGIACRGRQESIDDYFTGHGTLSGRFGALLIGLSIAATFFSGVSLVAYVGTSFRHGAAMILGLVCLPLAWLILRGWFLPRYLAENGRHPYEIIERRFGPAIRLCLSAMFILLRIGWMGVLIYAPALIVMGAAGLGPEWFWPVVAMVGVSSTVYTVLGGIRGVIVTDALQFVVILIGVFGVLVLTWAKLDLSAGAALAWLREQGRLAVFDFSLDPVRPFTFWAVVGGVTVSNLGSYLADQMSLQRYLASASLREAQRAFAVNVWSAGAVLVTLILAGLLLSVWYAHHPDPALPADPDLVLSHFIAKELPVGMSGLLIAAILAATMSSMTSGINSLAGALTNDWLLRFGRARTPQELYRFGRTASLAIGVVSTLAAGLAAHFGSLMIASFTVMGAFLGPMLAVMLLAVSRWQVRRSFVLSGLVAGVGCGWAVALSPATGLWVPPVSFAVAILIPLAGRLATAGAPELSRV
ncbi:MAG: hypothetical protein JNG83_10245 [Opitutaceae bacterium]|nr:hypothetical protein [Opitutaceae bacterium]